MENINFPSKKKWVKVKLGDLASTITKGSTPTTYGFNYLDKGIPFIKIENIENDKINHRSIRQFISNEAHEYQSRSQLQEGDILFSIAGTIGKTCIVTKNDIPSNTNQALSIIRGTKKYLLPKFLKLQFLSILSTTVKKKARGGAMSNISLNDLKKMDILLPSIQEQNRIVEKIETLFSDLDKATEDLKKTQEQLKIYRQAVLKAAFKGKYTGYYNDNWEDTILGDIADWGSGGTPSRKESKYFSGNIPWIKTGELGAKHIYDTEEKITKSAVKNSSAKIFPEGSVVIAMYGATIGKCSILGINASTNQACGVADAKKNKINNIFLYYYLISQKNEFIRKGQGGAQPNISQTILKNYPIKLPPIITQMSIVQEIESRLSVCDKLKETVEQSLNKIKYLRQSILKKAFEGNLVPQNPEDEPAEKLLERIKQEKEKFELNKKKRK